MINDPFVDRLKELIKERCPGKGSKSRFAALLGITPQNLNDWIKKGYKPKTDHLLNIKEKLGVSIDWLLTGQEPKYIEKEGRVGYTHRVAEAEAEYEAISRQDRAYIDKLKTVLHEGNETAKGMIKTMIDKAVEEIEGAKKTKAMAG